MAKSKRIQDLESGIIKALSTLSFTAGRLDALGKSTKEIDSTIEKLKKLIKYNQ